jgi:hypothetical protein
MRFHQATGQSGPMPLLELTLAGAVGSALGWGLLPPGRREQPGPHSARAATPQSDSRLASTARRPAQGRRSDAPGRCAGGEEEWWFPWQEEQLLPSPSGTARGCKGGAAAWLALDARTVVAPEPAVTGLPPAR